MLVTPNMGEFNPAFPLELSRPNEGADMKEADG